ncbi:MAG: SDR family NAD(P)-dependent oxidoreductase [Myxococcaceae bacterium]|jgi:NAD(P)-dependent dehydrogenase (short-subunit alcohol dehydrogenase family)|nr:SDR family NAD(P)-dependent oxidoreductase [Myxococcaceae bacterium]
MTARPTMLVTGANTGIGLATATGLARRGAKVLFAGRSREKTLAAIEQVRRATGNDDLHFVELDLANLEQVRACATTLKASEPRLDVLVLNAGLVRVRALTAQGFETTFGVNHLGHMLLTLLLEPLLVNAAPARVVVVASRAHERTNRPIDYETLRRPTATYSGWREYQQSKLANMLFAFELARRWKNERINVYALHPGVIASDIWRAAPTPLRQLGMLFMRTPEEGARASLHCATSDAAAGETGRYYDEDGSHRRPSPLALDEAAQATPWAYSMDALAPYL